MIETNLVFSDIYNFSEHTGEAPTKNITYNFAKQKFYLHLYFMKYTLDIDLLKYLPLQVNSKLISSIRQKNPHYFQDLGKALKKPLISTRNG